MTLPNLSNLMARDKMKQVADLLLKYGVDVPYTMDADTVVIGSFDIPKDCEKEIKKLGFLVMKMEVGVGVMPE